MSELTAEVVRSLLDYDRETGVFRWAVCEGRSNVRVGAVAGCIRSDGYCKIGIRRRPYVAHRLAWLYVYGVWPTHNIDHINGVRNDNRIVNLRDVPQAINNQNQRHAKSHSTSGYLGVFPRDGRYFAQIVTAGKAHYCGMYDTPDEASAAYRAAKRQLHAGCPA